MNHDDCLVCQTAKESAAALRVRSEALAKMADLAEALNRMHLVGRNDGVPVLASIHEVAMEQQNNGDLMYHAIIEAAVTIEEAQDKYEA